MSREYEVLATNHTGWEVQVREEGKAWTHAITNVTMGKEKDDKCFERPMDSFVNKSDAVAMLEEMSKFPTSEGLEFRVYPVLGKKKK